MPEQPAENYAVYSLRGMKWFKFIIYFQLFFSAIINLIMGVRCLSGSLLYGEMASSLYASFPALQILDKVTGVVSLGLTVAAVFVRMRLARYRQNGPVCYLGFLAVSLVVSLAYNIAAGIIAYRFLPFNLGQTLVSAIVPLILIFVNAAYFDKRKDLFVK